MTITVGFRKEVLPTNLARLFKEEPPKVVFSFGNSPSSGDDDITAREQEKECVRQALKTLGVDQHDIMEDGNTISVDFYTISKPYVYSKAIESAIKNTGAEVRLADSMKTYDARHENQKHEQEKGFDFGNVAPK